MAASNKGDVKKPNIFVRMGRKLKETFSELKRVTWPTFPKVLKSTAFCESDAAAGVYAVAG